MTDNQNLIDNLVRRIVDLAAYKDLIEKPGISTRAKSAYLRAAIMLATTIVEGLVFLLIRKYTDELNPVVGVFKEKKILYTFKQEELTDEGVYVCKDREKNITLTGRECTFQIMNKYCLEKGLISRGDFNTLEEVRKLRANFHVFIMQGIDRGYTTPILMKVEKQLDLLISKYSTVK